MRALALFTVLALPVAAQSSPEAATAATDTTALAVEAPAQVDSALVGAWTLDEVVEAGVLAEFGVEVQAMTCVFSADGQAEISMTAVQDGETLFRDRSFAFSTDDGTIVEDDGDAVPYRLLEDGSMELADGEMVIRFVRAVASEPAP